MQKTKSMSSSKITIVDTTLSDGEQIAGVFIAKKKKVRIARLLDEVGVHQIEAGMPAKGGDEKKAIKDIVNLGLKASIMGWNRAVLSDIEHSIECGVDAVAISMPTSDGHIKHRLNTTRESVLERMVQAVEFAKREGVYISVNAEDASGSDMDFLVQYATEAQKAGANRIRYCDTFGNLDPFSIYDRIKTLRDRVGIDIEMHTANVFGMATASALAGLKAGATHVGVTVTGLGESGGNAALEEVVMALKHIEGIDLGFKTEMFRGIAEYVSLALGRELPAWKAIVGSNMFAHESGIHADGVIKNPKNYEVFAPEEVGLRRQIVIGKHSGSKSLMFKFAEYGIHLTEKDAGELLPKIRSTAVDLKRSLFDKELVYIYEEIMRKA